MKIIKDPKEYYRHELEQLLKDNGVATITDFLDFLYDQYGEREVSIKHRYFDKPKSTLVNRLNSIWVYPLFILSIPYRYIVYGYYHINSNTRLARILNKLLGVY